MDKLKALVRLEESLGKLPSVGKKSAERMAFAMLDMEKDDLEEFADAIKSLKEQIHACPICGNITDEEYCSICTDNDRDKSLLMVVSSPKDIIAFENAEGFNGVYHVLGGAISSVNGIGPENLRINELVERIKKDQVEEVIIATNPTTEGEITAMYIAHLLEKENVTVTRLAYGLPMGGHLEYADALTLNKALEGRKKF